MTDNNSYTLQITQKSVFSIGSFFTPYRANGA